MDFGTGEWIVDSDGRRPRPWVLRIVAINGFVARSCSFDMSWFSPLKFESQSWPWLDHQSAG